MCRFGFLSLVNTWEDPKESKWYSTSAYIPAGYREVTELVVEVYYMDNILRKIKVEDVNDMSPFNISF